MEVIGWILIVLGVLFLIVGLIDAAKKLSGKDASVQNLSWWPFLIELVKSGLGLIAVGLLLLNQGLKMIGQCGFLDEECPSE